MDDIKIQIRFKEQTEKGEYSDALYFSEEEYNSIAQKRLQELKQQRIDAWVEKVNKQSKSRELTEDEISNAILDIDKQKEELDIQKIDLLSKLSMLKNK